MNKNISDNANDVLNIFNCILKEESIYSIENFSLAFLALSSEEKQEIYSDKDFLDNTCIMDAIDNNKPDLAFTLIDLGFDPNIPNIKGVNPLINSIINKQEKLALELIDLTVDLNFARSSNGVKNGDTALIYAISKELPLVVEKLIKSGADPFYTNEFKQTALFYCTKTSDQYLKIFEFLLPIYQEKAFINNLMGSSIVENIFRYGTEEHLNIIASQELLFPNLTQKHLELLKKTTQNSYSNSNGANSFTEYHGLINYWDKMKDMIALNKKFKSKDSPKIKSLKI